MDREEGSHDVSSVYVYNGVDEVPEDVKYVRVDPSVTVIPNSAFHERYELVEVELPEGLVTIGSFAFHCCNSLERINIPSTVKYIEEEAFSGIAGSSNKKLEVVVLPDGLRGLGNYAFYCCESLQMINIPPG